MIALDLKRIPPDAIRFELKNLCLRFLAFSGTKRVKCEDVDNALFLGVIGILNDLFSKKVSHLNSVFELFIQIFVKQT